MLDVITLRLICHRPEHYQYENYVIDDNEHWLYSHRISWHEIQRAVDNPLGPLWLNGCSSTYGENDRVIEADTVQLENSLYLIRPERLHLVVARESAGESGSKRKVRARFQFGGHSYCLAVTDPFMESRYYARPDGQYPLDEALLCISLSELFHGHSYKLAAAVITPDRARNAP